MTSTRDRFRSLQAAITPSKPETDAAFQRAVSACASLNEEFYPGTEFETSRMEVVGSMATRTAIKPASDVDVIFKLPLLTWFQYEGYSGNGQSALLQKVRSTLLRTYPRSEIKGDGPVVKVQFKTGSWVEVVPGLPWKGDYFVPQTSGGGSWALSNYDAEFKMIVVSNVETKGQTGRLVRLAKAWKRECNVPMKSKHLNLLAVRFLETWEHSSKDEHWDDWMVRDFFEYAVGKAGHFVSDAEGSLAYLGEGWKSRAETAHNRASRACEFEASSEGSSAAPLWGMIFGVHLGY